ncbi:hypothetical protein like AT4G38213 [Hibiscus trionum]|uniref:Uncharacterized protein n=1 Tax=Hibiscus trionum TaxID=183268 RepID=A0A9W7M159_HIBTR|nr:hypothetical protein like AT4G38213 [Hibiscus trionum]
MVECMSLSLCMKKLALWKTTTFKPLMTHDELEPVMATMGFVGLPPYQGSSGGLAWKEYVYHAARRPKSLSSSRSTTDEPPSAATELRRPKLPFPRIDGVHIYTYRAFLDAVNFHIQMWNISDVFHIRGMPIQPSDRCRRWRCMKDGSNFVYSDGTLEVPTYNLYQSIKPNSDSSNGDGGRNDDEDYGSGGIRDKGNSDRTGCFVPLKDIIVAV